MVIGPGDPFFIAGTHVHGAVTIAEIVAVSAVGKNFGVDTGTAYAGGQRGQHDAAVHALAPDAGHCAGQQAQQADRVEGGAAFDRQAGVLPHLERGIADHKDQVGARSGLDRVTGLNRLLRAQPGAVDHGVSRQLHDVASLLRHCRRQSTECHPGRGGLDHIAPLKPEDFFFLPALQQVLGHGISPGVVGSSVGGASKLSSNVK